MYCPVRKYPQNTGTCLAIFGEDTQVEKIREFLIRAGFTGERYGSLEAASTQNMDTLAEWIDQMEGVAIAAHVDSTMAL